MTQPLLALIPLLEVKREVSKGQVLEKDQNLIFVVDEAAYRRRYAQVDPASEYHKVVSIRILLFAPCHIYQRLAELFRT